MRERAKKPDFLVTEYVQFKVTEKSGFWPFHVSFFTLHSSSVLRLPSIHYNSNRQSETQNRKSAVVATIELVILTLITLLSNTVVLSALYRRQGGQWLRAIDERRWGAALRELGAFFVMVGIPFLALITGAAGMNLLALGADLTDPAALAGFTFADWVRGVGVMSAVIVVILAALWLGARAAPRGQAWSLGWLAVRDALYNEVHWTFYRVAPALLLADPYWGVVIGVVLVLGEWLTSPASEFSLNTIEGRQYFALRLACLFASCILYLAIRNLWLMIVADLLIQLVGARLLSGRTTSSLEAQS